MSCGQDAEVEGAPMHEGPESLPGTRAAEGALPSKSGCEVRDRLARRAAACRAATAATYEHASARAGDAQTFLFVLPAACT